MCNGKNWIESEIERKKKDKCHLFFNKSQYRGFCMCYKWVHELHDYALQDVEG